MPELGLPLYSGWMSSYISSYSGTTVAHSTTHSLTVSTKLSFSFVLPHTFLVLATFYNSVNNIQTEHIVFVIDTPVSDINRCFSLK